VLCGKDRTGELWSLKALHQYVIDHGWKQGYVVGADRLRTWLAAPELQDKLKLWQPAPKPPAKQLPARLKGVARMANGLNGFGSRGDDQSPPVPVTLPTVFFAFRPEIPLTDRERLGGDYKPPAPVTQPHRRNDDEIVLEGEAALRRIRGSAPMQDWLKIGRALLVLRKRAMQETGTKKPRGLPYVTRNSALLRQHGFMAISRSARQTAMLVVENLPAIEAWLATLPDDKRLGLNHPMVVWRGYLAAQRKRNNRISEGAWRDRKMMPEGDFQALFAAIAETLPSGDAMTISMSACRALGFAVPKSALRRAQEQESRSRPPHPPLRWSPFALSI
jgi:hypothetical protein